MNRNLVYIVLAVCLVLTVRSDIVTASAGADPPDEDLLQVHLPRAVTVRDNLLSLGQVSVVRGVTPLATTARNIGLGRLSLPGQTIVLDRSTILSRLASHGIPAGRVRLTGADAVTVRRQQKIINTDEFIDMAQQFLQQHPPIASLHESVAVGRPKDLVLPAQLDGIQVERRIVRNGADGFVTVQIAVAVDGREIGHREIPFRLRYRRRRAVTLQEIPKGTALTPDNMEIEETVSDRPEPVGWKPPYGSIARRTLSAKTELHEEMVESVQPAVVIRRNETVVIRVQRPGFLVTAVGLALEQAHAGEYLKVRNTDSLRVIMCRVSADGTVEPVL